MHRNQQNTILRIVFALGMAFFLHCVRLAHDDAERTRMKLEGKESARRFTKAAREMEICQEKELDIETAQQKNSQG